MDEQSNIVGFSMFNTTHPFYLEFIRSLNLSWREGCDLTYPGPAVSLSDSPMLMFFFFVLWNFVLFHPTWINGPVNVIQPVFFLYLIAIDLYIWALPQTALSAPQNLFSSSSLMFPLSPSLLTNQSPYGLVFP